jgi:hypothetical protein
MPWRNLRSFPYNVASVQHNAPAASGVYGIFTRHEWIYIGESQDIQARLVQHLNGDNPCVSLSGHLVQLRAGAGSAAGRAAERSGAGVPAGVQPLRAGPRNLRAPALPAQRFLGEGFRKGGEAPVRVIAPVPRLVVLV